MSGYEHRTKHMELPRYRNDFNLGQLIHVFTVLSAIVSFTWWQSGDRAEIKVTLDRLDKVVTKLDTTVTPLLSNDRLQDERINSLSIALQELRNINTQLLVQMGAVREDLAVIKAQRK